MQYLHPSVKVHTLVQYYKIYWQQGYNDLKHMLSNANILCVDAPWDLSAAQVEAAAIYAIYMECAEFLRDVGLFMALFVIFLWNIIREGNWIARNTLPHS